MTDPLRWSARWLTVGLALGLLVTVTIEVMG